VLVVSKLTLFAIYSLPDSWKLQEIFAMRVVLGSYLALMTIICWKGEPFIHK